MVLPWAPMVLSWVFHGAFVEAYFFGAPFVFTVLVACVTITDFLELGFGRRTELALL